MYKKITVGGTFDQFHVGHEALLTRAFTEGEQVLLGITTDDFARSFETKKSRFPLLLQPFAQRVRTVKDFLRTQNWLERVTIIPITDRFGTTLIDETLEAIVVSPETERVAQEINAKRQEKKWAALAVSVVPWVLAEDGKAIHSVRIRAGEIDTDGSLFIPESDWGLRRLPAALRSAFKEPLGQLFKKTTDEQKTITECLEKSLKHPAAIPVIIAVGDAVTRSLLKINMVPQVSIVDLHIQRKAVYDQVRDLEFGPETGHHLLTNAPGTLSYQAFQTMYEALHVSTHPTVIEVQGEEDLLTVCAILVAPLGSLVIYGQPNQGVVGVVVSLEQKRTMREYVRQFPPCKTVFDLV